MLDYGTRPCRKAIWRGEDLEPHAERDRGPDTSVFQLSPEFHLSQEQSHSHMNKDILDVPASAPSSCSNKTDQTRPRSAEEPSS